MKRRAGIGLLVLLLLVAMWFIRQGSIDTQAAHAPKLTRTTPTVASSPGIVPSLPSNALNSADSCQETQGTLAADQVHNSTTGKLTPLILYLPPCFDHPQSIPYPVLYLLPGEGGDETQWLHLGLDRAMNAAIHSGSPATIIVSTLLPDELTWPSDVNENYLVDDLIPFIDSHYPTSASREQRAIGGFSRGAAWALRLGVTRADLFSKIGMHSLALYDAEVLQWVNRISQLPAAERPALFLDSGDLDQALGTGLLMRSALTQLEIPHSWHLLNGGHDTSYWSDSLPIYLNWYTRGW